jgi:hypothetical protein
MATLSCPHIVSSASEPFGYVFSWEGTRHVDYVGTNGHIYELWWNPTGWHVEDLAALTGAPLAHFGAGVWGYPFDPAPGIPNPTQHVRIGASIRCGGTRPGGTTTTCTGYPVRRWPPATRPDSLTPEGHPTRLFRQRHQPHHRAPVEALSRRRGPKVFARCRMRMGRSLACSHGITVSSRQNHVPNGPDTRNFPLCHYFAGRKN